VYNLFDSNKVTINDLNHGGAYGNGYIENLHVENKETYKKLIESQEKQIESLKKQIERPEKQLEFLRSLLVK
jgi:hypothetical protein